MSGAPIRIFVGCAAGGEDAESCAVLEYSLRRHGSRPVEITWMHAAAEPQKVWGGWNTLGWATPFSGYRWGIPAACGYEGRAIYMDSDVILRADIAELWDQVIPDGVFVMVRPGDGKLRTCVMLMDCDIAVAPTPQLATLKREAGQHGRMLKRLKASPRLVGRYEGQWNCLDLKGAAGVDDPAVKLIHYSQMAHQPHLKHAKARLAAQGRSHWYDGDTGPHWRPELQALFDRLLTEAEAAGFAPAAYDWGWRRGYDMKSWAGRPVKAVSV